MSLSNSLYFLETDYCQKVLMQENENLRDVQRKCYKFINWPTGLTIRSREGSLIIYQFRSGNFKQSHIQVGFNQIQGF